MARILYGVHGSQHGHAIRALILARRLAALGHEFLFVSSEEGAGLLEREFRVERFENPGTRYRNQCLDTPATVKLALRTLARRESELRRLDRLIRDFRPDRAIADYEYFVPIAAGRTGIPCLSIDHQHVISCCRHPVPARFWPDYLGIRASIKFLFSACSDYLAISFFQPPAGPGPGPGWRRRSCAKASSSAPRAGEITSWSTRAAASATPLPPICAASTGNLGSTATRWTRSRAI